MRVTAISSTPRKGGNSDILIDRVVEAARSNGAKAEKLQIARMNIRPCTACDACQDSMDSPCVIKDDTQGVLDKLIVSDAIVFGAPVYNFAVAAQLKLLLDRMYSLGGGGRWDALAGRRIGIVLTYADEDRLESGVENAVGMFRDMARFLDVTIGGIVEAQCGPAGEVLQNASALAAAGELGMLLARVP
jgi:multimeric flavodoxin WrbA